MYNIDMDNNYGIKITAPGTNVNFASGQDVVFNSKNPLLKIDSQNTKGFQTVNLTIVNDPPEPTAPSYTDTYTVVYKFAHGYTYTPSVETLYVLITPTGGAYSFHQDYFLDFGIIASSAYDNFAAIYTVVDSTNVYYVVWKQNGGSGGTNTLSGAYLKITSHVFVDDLSGT